MKTNDLLLIATTAIGTAALTVAVLTPAQLNADSESVPGPQINQPRLLAEGLEMTLKPVNGRSPKAGEPLALELKAVSITNQPVTACVRIAMSASSPADALSRVMRLPTMLWQNEQFVTVPPHETKAFTLNTVTNLPANKIFSVTLQGVKSPEGPLPSTASSLAPALFAGGIGRAGIVALTFSTAAPRPELPIISSR